MAKMLTGALCFAEHTVDVLQCVANELGLHNVLFIDGDATCEMFTSSSHSKDKQRILANFTNPSSALRVVVATVAFGIGIDAPNVRHVIHWGPPKTIDLFM